MAVGMNPNSREPFRLLLSSRESFRGASPYAPLFLFEVRR